MKALYRWDFFRKRALSKCFFSFALILSFSTYASAAEKRPRFTQSEHACTQYESWNFSKDIPSAWIEEYNKSISDRTPLIYSFSEALALQREAPNSVARLFGVYWKNRSLQAAGLIHSAVTGFYWIAAQPLKRKTIAIQLAALNCINQVHYDYPRIGFPKEVVARFPSYSRMLSGSMKRDKRGRRTFWESVGIHIRHLIGEGHSAKEIEEFLPMLAESTPHYTFAKGLVSAYVHNYKATISSLKKFVNHSSLPKPLQRYIDTAYLTLGRAFYMLRKFDQAETYLKKVSKDSNKMVRVLAELSWVYLMEDQFGDAVGTVMNLQSGGLRHTFTPESLMVMAIGLNELCQYPSSLRTIRFIKRNYRETYSWLRDWMKRNRKNPGSYANFYPSLIRHVEGGKIDVPPRVVNEWIKSPVFLAYQTEINLFEDEKASEREFKKAQRKELAEKKIQLRILTDNVKQRKIDEKAKGKKVKQLSEGLKKDIINLKNEARRFKRLAGSVKEFSKLAGIGKRQGRKIRHRLVERINSDLNQRNVQMLKMLKQVAENTYLVEVEIYNGASEDVIWQNAHPDYREFVKNMNEKAKNLNADDVWNWGKQQKAEDGQEEVWADELGTLRADLNDNCGNKDKYLEVKYDGYIASHTSEK